MSIWNKILVGLIIVCSLVFFYMAAWTLKMQQTWRESARRLEQKTEQFRQENEKLAEGTEKEGQPAQPGIRQLRSQLNQVVVDRGQAWFKCNAQAKTDPANGTAEVTITNEQSDFLGMPKDTVVYGFEVAPIQDKGRYLGEFKVTKADEKQVVLAPASRLSPREMERLGTAKGGWDLYVIMPRDSHRVFAGLDDQQKKALLPADALSEYLKDGKPAAKDDPADRVAAGQYVRPLRDYQVLLSADRLRASYLGEKIDAADGDQKLVGGALAQAKEQEAASEKELAATKAEVKDFEGQRDVVNQYLQLLQREFEAVKAAIARLMESNREMAGRLAKLQFEAARRIDQRTRAVAQSGAGGA
jgi:hypothetical protein